MKIKKYLLKIKITEEMENMKIRNTRYKGKKLRLSLCMKLILSKWFINFETKHIFFTNLKFKQ